MTDNCNSMMQASDCSWLYCDRDLLSSALAGILKKPERAHQLPYILEAFLDPHGLFQQAPNVADRALLKQVCPRKLYATDNS